jgi:hypothetical protein
LSSWFEANFDEVEGGIRFGTAMLHDHNYKYGAGAAFTG